MNKTLCLLIALLITTIVHPMHKKTKNLLQEKGSKKRVHWTNENSPYGILSGEMKSSRLNRPSKQQRSKPPIDTHGCIDAMDEEYKNREQPTPSCKLSHSDSSEIQNIIVPQIQTLSETCSVQTNPDNQQIFFPVFVPAEQFQLNKEKIQYEAIIAAQHYGKTILYDHFSKILHTQDTHGNKEYRAIMFIIIGYIAWDDYSTRISLTKSPEQALQ